MIPHNINSIIAATAALRRVRVLTLTCLLGMIAPPPAQPATLQWDGSHSRNWDNAYNWSPPGVAVGWDKVLIFPRHWPVPIITNNFASWEFVERIELFGDGTQITGNGIQLSNLVVRLAPGVWSWVDIWLADSTRWGSFPLRVTVVTNDSKLYLSGVTLNWRGLLVEGAGDVVIHDLDGSANLYKASAGELWITGFGPQNYAGTLYATNGILHLMRSISSGGTAGRPATSGDLAVGRGTNGPISDIIVLELADQIHDAKKVSIAATGQLDFNGFNDSVSNLVMTGGSVVTRLGTLNLLGDITGYPASSDSVVSGNLTLDPGATTHDFLIQSGARMQVEAKISGGVRVALVKTGAGELFLNSSNTYAGATRVCQGILTLKNNYALGSSVAGTTLEGGALRLDNVAILNEPLDVDAPALLLNRGASNFWRSAITLNTNLTVVVSNANLLVLSNTITGSGGLTKSEGGTLKLTGPTANTYAGMTAASSGSLWLAKPPGLSAVPGDLTVGDGAGGAETDIVQLLADEQIANSSAVAVAASGRLDLSGQAETIRRLTGTGVVRLGAGTLTVSNDTDHAFGGMISGGRDGYAGADLAKTGPGTWTLSGSNAYWGRTYVQGGTLLINGFLANSDTIVSPGATLGGTGKVQRVSFSGSGGMLSPGASAGQLRAEGLVMAGGTLVIELNGLTPGSGYDQLITENSPSLTPQTGQPSGLNIVPGFTPPAGSSFVILRNDSGKSVAGTFSAKPEGSLFMGGSLAFQITYTGGDGNDVVITRVAPPAVSNFVAWTQGGQMQMQARGVAGLSYVLEAAPHLNPPLAWQPIATATANKSGLLEFVDPDMLLHVQRFYRVVSP